MTKKPVIFLAATIFTISFLARLIFIFKITIPDSSPMLYDDAPARWIIAYLSREVGFKEGFLKLSDREVGSMQYFWGLMHPLLTVAAFKLTGHIDFWVQRLMTAFLGSMSVVIIFLIAKRFWGIKIALFSALFAALTPIPIFNDSSGMAEPIGVLFLLTAVYLWPEKPFLTGASLTLSLMARVENWVLATGMVISMLLFSAHAKREDKIFLVLGYLTPLSFYLLYLYFYTGNPISPLSGNFTFNISQGWVTSYVPPPPVWIRHAFVGILLTASMISLAVVKKKPKESFLYLLGLGNLILLGIIFGISKFSRAFFVGILYQRRLLLVYEIFVILLSAFFFKNSWLGKIKLFKIKLNSLLALSIFITLQTLWIPIMNDYSSLKKTIWENPIVLNSREIGKYYRGGGILIIDSYYPIIYYSLVSYGGIPGTNIVTDLLEPYYTMVEDPFVNWNEYKRQMLSWIKEKNIRTIVTYTKYSYRFSRLAKEEPGHFSLPQYSSDIKLVVYQVN